MNKTNEIKDTPRNPLPPEYYNQAEVVDMPGVRVWGDDKSKLLHDDVVQSIRNEKAGLFPRGPEGELQYAGLAISGGGDHGAFGAGFQPGSFPCCPSRITFREPDAPHSKRVPCSHDLLLFLGDMFGTGTPRSFGYDECRREKEAVFGSW